MQRRESHTSRTWRSARILPDHFILRWFLENFSMCHDHFDLMILDANTDNVKGEVRAICRFWVFDGNGLLGHRLIDSRWFEKNPPTESGWKRRSKKNAHVPVVRAEMIVTQYVLSSSRHLVTPLIYIHFCVWLGLFVDRWWLKEVWYAPESLSNCSTCVFVAAPGRTGSPSKRICRGTLSQKTWNWSTHVQSEDQRVFVCAKPSPFS